MVRMLRNNPLLHRILIYVFCVAALVSVLGCSVQLYFAFQNEKAHLNGMLDSFKNNQLDTLCRNIWALDQNSIDVQLQGLIEHPDIVSIELINEHNEALSFGSKPPSSAELIERSFPLQINLAGKNKPLGKITFTATTANIKSKLFKTASDLLLAQLFTLLMTCAFILFLFFSLFNRHINTIAAYTESLRLDQLDDALILERAPRGKADELDQIVKALNNMRERIKTQAEAQLQFQDKLVREKQFSDAIINSLPGLFFLVNKDLRPLRYNGHFLEKLGETSEADDSPEFFTQISPETAPAMRTAITAIFTSGLSQSLEIELRHHQGQKTPYLFTISRLQLADDLLLIGVGTDLTAQKRVEGQLRQSQKMEAIGTLAGGIAHDFNNILSAIFGYNQLAQMSTSKDSKIYSFLEEIGKASMRAKDLVAQILSFSRKTETVRHPIQVYLVIKEALKLIRASIPASITIQQNIESRLAVVADPTEIHQIIMNLCTNSYHAMEKSGGTLTISLREREVTSHDYLPDTNVRPGLYLCLEVSDTGMGMDKETREKIFEPYFTTKEAGSGTGLGLAVVHGIISQYHGSISVYSAPGKGTAFSILLPAADLDGEEITQHFEINEEELPHGNEHILVVDDDASIIKFYNELLTTFGYRVTSFSSSIRAYNHFRQDPSAVDLIITDLTMPEMTGDLLGPACLELRQDLPIIICSGFSANYGRNNLLAMGFADFFVKPVESKMLIWRIRELLDRAPATPKMARITDLFTAE